MHKTDASNAVFFIPFLKWSLICPLLLIMTPILPARAAIVGSTPGSFRVSEAGAATYSIPIVAPPGTAGMAPNLSLNYSSQSGNGVLGIGWLLGGLSSIHRCPATYAQDGFKGGINYDANDRFCLDGQRLVAINGGYGANGTEYRTETESYSRIISYGKAGNGPAWFKVWTKAGQIMEYGNSADSRIEAQGRADVRMWGVNKISDTKSNYLSLAYTENTATGEAYVSRIDYTGNAVAALAPYASVQFVYASRPDTSTLYVAGDAVKNTQRLSNIKTYSGTKLVKDYWIAYDQSPATQSSRIITITECAATECLPPTAIKWQGASDAWGGAFWNGGPSVATPVGNQCFPGDFNGDGKADITCYTTTGDKWHTVLSTGAGWSGAFWNGGPSVATPVGSQCFPGDFNGDGKTDISCYTTTGDKWHTVLSTGAGWSGAFWNGGPSVATPVGSQCFPGDFNGDGKTDISCYTTTGDKWHTVLSTGAGWSGAFWNGGPSVATPVGSQCIPSDFNGDGKTDITCYTTSGGSWHTVLSTGAGWSGAFWMGGPSVATPIEKQCIPGDFNADAKTDLTCYTTAGGQWHTVLSTGSGWSGAFWAGGPSVASPVGSQCLPGDFNGDGKMDISCYTGSNGQWHVALVGGQIPDLVTSIATGLGATTSITYKPLTDGSVYSKDTSAAYPNLDFQGSLYVVSKSLASNGVGGNYETAYTYAGAKFHITSGNLLGFRQIVAKDIQTGIVTTTTYRQDYSNQGLPLSIEKRTQTGQLLNRVQNTWQNINLGSGAYHRSDLVQTVEQSWDLNGAALPRTKTDTAYDNYGNATEITVATDDSYTSVPVSPYGNLKVTRNTYINDTQNWILGRLTRATVTGILPAGESATRTSAFAYEPGGGLLIQEIVEPDIAAYRLVTDYTLDVYGNRIKTQISGADIATRAGNSVFDAKGRVPVSTSNALGHTETRTYEPAFGNPLSLFDANGLTTKWAYDRFGRKTQEIRPDATYSVFTYAWCDASCPARAVYTATIKTSGAPTVITYFDNLNREIRRAVVGFDGRNAFTDTQYDSLGRIVAKSRPYFAGDANAWTQFTYDILGRVIRVTEPDGGVTQTNYNGLTVTLINALGYETRQIKNGLGQIIETVDASGSSMLFDFDPFGNPTRTTDPQGNTLTLTYDLRGRKITMNDPDMGLWTYAYDVLGQLLWQRDAKGQATTIGYDLLGRMTQRNEPGLTSMWTWDAAAKGIGKLAKETASSGFSRSYSYDSYSRPISAQSMIEGNSYLLSTTYDSYGRVLQQIYPTGFALFNVYNANGYLTEVRNAATQKPFWRAGAVDAAGRVTQETLGNGMVTRREFDEMERIVGIFTSKPLEILPTVQSLSFTYDPLNNVISRDDAVTQRSDTFGYDELNRLVSDSTIRGAKLTILNVQYDAIGNIVYKSDVGNYTYGSKPHAVTQISGAVNTAFSYDANGNQTQGLNRTLTYTAWNMPAQIAKGPTALTYKYDGNHERFLQAGTTGTSIYLNPRVDLGGHFEQTLFLNGTKESRHYIYAGKAIVGEYVITAAGIKETHYFHTDQLGSVEAVSDDAGNILARYSYAPFGVPTKLQGDANASGRHGFTGHEHIKGIALIHMNGRLYDPLTARFVSADPYIQSPGNLQSYNRYSYVLNNPLAYTDPSGYFLGRVGKFFSKIWHSDIMRTVLAITASASIVYWEPFSLAFANALAGGFASGVVQTGSLQGGVNGLYGAALFYGAGEIGQKLSLSLPGRVVAHAAAGCVSAEVSGGKCGQQALAAGFSEVAGPLTSSYSNAGNLVAHSVIGGTASVLGGGKFSNGAMTGAYGYLFNELLHPEDNQKTVEKENKSIAVKGFKIIEIVKDGLDLIEDPKIFLVEYAISERVNRFVDTLAPPIKVFPNTDQTFSVIDPASLVISGLDMFENTMNIVKDTFDRANQNYKWQQLPSGGLHLADP